MKRSDIKTKITKSPAMYTAIGLAVLFTVLGAGYLVVDSIATVVDKKQLVNAGSQIVATVTGRDSSFNPFRGGGFTAYSIDYEFAYTNENGALSKQARTDFVVPEELYRMHELGSTVIVTYLPSDPTINEPAESIKSVDSSSVVLVKLFFGIALSIAMIIGFHKIVPAILGKKDVITMVVVLGLISVSLFAGSMLGSFAVEVFESAVLVQTIRS